MDTSDSDCFVLSIHRSLQDPLVIDCVEAMVFNNKPILSSDLCTMKFALKVHGEKYVAVMKYIWVTCAMSNTTKSKADVIQMDNFQENIRTLEVNSSNIQVH